MKPRKTLEKILSGSRNIAFSDMVSLVEALGFRLKRIRGSHHMFSHPGIRELINLQPDGGQAKPYQIQEVLKRIEEFNLSLGDDE